MKWIKQHLWTKPFWGMSENAVKPQIWIAVSVYVRIASIKKRLNQDTSLYTLLQILSATLFEKMSSLPGNACCDNKMSHGSHCNQLNLFMLAIQR